MFHIKCLYYFYLEYGSDYSEDLNTSNKIRTIKIRIVNFCKESSTEKDVIIKTLPITMTLNRLKDLGKRLFGLGNKQLEFSYLTKEVNLNSSKIKTMYLLSTSVFYTLFFLYFHLLLSVMYCVGHPCPLPPKNFLSIFYTHSNYLKRG